MITTIIVMFLCLITWLNWSDIRSILSIVRNVEKRVSELEGTQQEKDAILKS